MKKIILFILFGIILFIGASNSQQVYALEKTTPSIDYNGTSYSIDEISYLEEQKQEYVELMNHAHDMADSARALELQEKNMIIEIAQKEYLAYQDKYNEINNILNELYEIIPEYTEKDVYLLGKLIYAEAGSDYCPDELQLMVGNVVLNRVENGYWGDSLEDVIYAPGQYSPTFNKQKWNSIEPDGRALNNARKLLMGERWCPENVLWQANFKQGNGVYWRWRGPSSTMYFCYD